MRRALKLDLERWADNQSDREAWIAYTERLIALRGRKRKPKAIVDNIRKKGLIASQVLEVATEALQEAFRRRDEDNHEALDTFVQRSFDISEGIREVLMFYDADEVSLEQVYKEGSLAWQRI